jgi:hypothetical protein
MQEGIPFKILLLLDNTPSHPPALEDLSDNIKIVFLLPNTTSLLQPMDQGVIKTFKSYCLRSTLDALLKVMNDGRTTVNEFWNAFNIKDAINIIKISWQQVPRQCINGVWNKICTQFYHDLRGFNTEYNITTSNKESMKVAQKAGLGEVHEEDIEDLLESHTKELTDEDLLELEKERQHEEEDTANQPEPSTRQLTAKRLARTFDHISAAVAIF